MVPKTRELLPEPDTPVKDDQPALGDIESDVTKVVLAGPLDPDEVVAAGTAPSRD
jgi:hypothetical protein